MRREELKTQFLSAEMHAMIIGLLKYINEHHIPNIEVKDESGYLETGDYQALEDNIRLIQEKIDYLSRELSSEYFGCVRGLSADEIAARIERLFHAQDVKSKYDN